MLSICKKKVNKMPIKKPTRLLSKPTKAPQPDEYIIRGSYGETIPVDKNGYYKFKSSANGEISFRVSRMAKDYPSFGLDVQLSAYVNAYVAFSRLWLASHGYIPKIVFCNGYTVPGAFDWQDNQAQLRQKITADFLAPSNYGKPMNQWRGVVQEKSEAARRGYSIDYGSKG
jgi:hypothetical protein